MGTRSWLWPVYKTREARIGDLPAEFPIRLSVKGKIVTPKGKIVNPCERAVSGIRDAIPRHLLTPAHLLAHPTPALVARAQGGLTLGPERGELAALF